MSGGSLDELAAALRRLQRQAGEPSTHEIFFLAISGTAVPAGEGVPAWRAEEVPHDLAGQAHAAMLRGKFEPDALQWAARRSSVAETPKSCLKSRANWSGRR
jgi:hypothetical protein